MTNEKAVLVAGVILNELEIEEMDEVIAPGMTLSE